MQPAPLTPAKIDVYMGAIWFPMGYYRQFMYETIQTSGYEKVIEGGDNRHRIDIEYFSIPRPGVSPIKMRNRIP